jgi:O-acetyl-ADP-ribose deacetylase (regulator of RNase III)
MKPRVEAIVHAIGPRYTEATKIANALELNMVYLRSIDAAARGKLINNLTIVFPAISTGIFGYLMAEAARIAVNSIFE